MWWKGFITYIYFYGQNLNFIYEKLIEINVTYLIDTFFINKLISSCVQLCR